MLEKLDEIEEEYEELTKKLSDPSLLADKKRYSEVSKTYARLGPLVSKIREYKKILSDIKEAEELLHQREEEMEEYLHQELKSLKQQKQKREEELKNALIAEDPNDEKDVIVEIRAGTGGEEAALFAADLYRMYSRYAERQGFKPEMISANPSGVGGFKEVILEVKGGGAFSRFKYESGVHRVQRVPVTESSGRIHTSAATVAVLPEAEEVEVEIDPKDLRIDTYRSSGAGGQHVNVTDSAVRVTHVPTGIVASCQEERSQLQNRERALRILRARLYEKLMLEQQKERAEERKSQVKTGDRSEKIRTYNFPERRVTDHRIGLTQHNLEAVLEGELGEIIEALAAAERAEKLKEA